MPQLIAFVLASMLALCSCVSAEKSAADFNKYQYVAVSDIVGAVKCAYATALFKEAKKTNGFKRLNGRVVALELSLKVVDTSAFSGNIEANAAGPFVVAATSGTGSILPRLSGSVTRTNTIETIVKSRLGLRGADVSVCIEHDKRQQVNYGFSVWLATLIDGLDQYAGYTPAGIVDAVTYDGSFQVVRKHGAGAKFDIIFVSGDIAADRERNDIQHIKMTIQAPSKEVEFPEEAYGVGPREERGTSIEAPPPPASPTEVPSSPTPTNPPGKTCVKTDPGTGVGILETCSAES